MRLAGSALDGFALKADGTAWGWGFNDQGQLGDGTTTTRSAPVQVAGLSGLTAVATAKDHGLAVQGGTGQVWAWGADNYHQLGDGGSMTPRTTPVAVPGLAGAVDVAAGTGFSLALMADGRVYGWGRLGGFYWTTPTWLTELSGIIAIRAGLSHALALKSDGTVWSWGDNAMGQLGRGAGHAASDIAQVPGLAGVLGIHALEQSSYAYGSGFLYAWGDDDTGQLGLGRPVFWPAPNPVQGVVLF